MAQPKTVQAAFLAFDDAIRLPRLDDGDAGQAILRTRRDELLGAGRKLMIQLREMIDKRP